MTPPVSTVTACWNVIVGSLLAESDVIVPLVTVVPVTRSDPGALLPMTWTAAPGPIVKLWIVWGRAMISGIGELSTTSSVAPGRGVGEDGGVCQSGETVKVCGPVP